MRGTLTAPPPRAPNNRPCPMSSSHVPPWEARPRPAPIMRPPKITVARMPTRSAIQPNAMAPVPAPSQAREFASAGMERGLASSSAIGLSDTTDKSGVPYENVKMNRTTQAANHDALVSMLCTGGAVAGASRDSAVERATTSSLALGLPLLHSFPYQARGFWGIFDDWAPPALRAHARTWRAQR
jgi:hypothetical protein